MRSLKRAATIANLNDPVLPEARRNFGARPAISVWQRRQEVPELVALGAEVLPVRLGRGNFDRDTLGDVQPVAFEADDLLGVVGQELQVLDPQVDQDLSSDAVITQIGVESERDVGRNPVLALILELVRAHLVEEPDPTALLPHVHEDPAPLGLDPAERLVELEATVAPARVEDVPGQALGVDADEHRRVAGHRAHHQRERHAAVDRGVVGNRGELSVVGRKLGRRDPPDQFFLVNPILDEVPDRNHLEGVRRRELCQLRHARHAAVLVEDLADDACRVAPRQPGEVDRGLGVAGAPQNTTPHRAQGKNVARTREVVGAHERVDERADRDGTVVGRGAGGNSPLGVDGDRERGAHGSGIVGDHHRDLELVQTLTEQRDADQAPTVLGHEVHGFRGHPVGRHHEVAFVLAIFVVHDEEDAPLTDLLDALLDGRKPGHVVPLSASERTRYLPITSASMFVACPGLSRPSVVTASVCGISMTSKVRSPSAATVRLTPSTATERWGISRGSSSRLGSVTRTRAVASTRVTSSTVPTPSTCPRTRWPPRAPPNRSGRSRLTGSPGWSRPSVVRASVSGPSSKTTSSSRRSTTVRHAPFTATLAPTSLPSSVTPACTPSRSVVPARASATTVPISSTIPVNIYSTSGGAAPLPPTTPHRPPKTAASAHRLRRPRRRSNRALSDTLLRPLWLTESRPPPPGCRRRSA